MTLSTSNSPSIVRPATVNVDSDDNWRKSRSVSTPHRPRAASKWNENAPPTLSTASARLRKIGRVTGPADISPSITGAQK